MNENENISNDKDQPWNGTDSYGTDDVKYGRRRLSLGVSGKEMFQI